jgi:hypothetical protein
MSASASNGAAKAVYPQYAPAKFERMFIFNPRFGPKEETADEKLLFYYPPTASPAIKFSDIGLSEALSNVTKYCIFDSHRKKGKFFVALLFVPNFFLSVAWRKLTLSLALLGPSPTFLLKLCEL